MEKLHSIPNANQYFSFAQRNHVGVVDKALSQRVESCKAWDMWETWVAQALTALQLLHSHGIVHGSITPTSLRVEEETLKLGGLQHVRLRGSLPPSDTFHANTLYTPPELLLYWGTRQGIPVSSMIHALQQGNWPMNRIESFFREHSHTKTVLKNIQDGIETRIEKLGEASDVWMLGYSLLSVYADMLGNPFAISSSFYANRHGEFLDLLASMVAPDPTKRSSIDEVQRKWLSIVSAVPSETAPVSEPEKTSETAPSEISETSETAPSKTAKTSATSEVVQQSEIQSSEPVRPVRHRRVVLKSPVGSAERNKTRRNPRS